MKGCDFERGVWILFSITDTTNFNGQYEQQEKPVSKFIWASDYYFKTHLNFSFMSSDIPHFP